MNALSREFDYIVVGAGTSGSVVASRLAKEGAKVLLLDAGSSPNRPELAEPTQWYRMLMQNRGMHWSYTTPPQRRLHGRRLAITQGKALGGSSSINAMIYARGVREDFDRWADAGCEGWGYTQVEPYFADLERLLQPVTADPDEFSEALFSSALACGIPYNPNYNGSQRLGASPAQYLWTQDGRRNTPYEALVASSRNHTLDVLPNARVSRILFSGGDGRSALRAVGVEVDVGGRPERIHAGEVLLAAGALVSPQILLHSGIGAREKVERLGLDPLVDLPAVGANLYDDVFVPLTFSAKRPINALPPALVWAATDGVPHAPIDVEISFGGHSLPGLASGNKDALTMFCSVMQLESRGELAVTPGGRISIDPCYLSTRADFERCERALRLAQQIGAAPPLQEWLNPPDFPAESSLRSYIAKSAGTTHHYGGTCTMGALADGSVVNAQLQVWGVEGLRVCDMSVTPLPITGNPAGTAMMIGAKAADMVLGRVPQDRAVPCVS